MCIILQCGDSCKHITYVWGEISLSRFPCKMTFATRFTCCRKTTAVLASPFGCIGSISAPPLIAIKQYYVDTVYVFLNISMKYPTLEHLHCVKLCLYWHKIFRELGVITANISALLLFCSKYLLLKADISEILAELQYFIPLYLYLKQNQ